MNVTVIKKASFTTIEYASVKNIAFASGVYSITLSDNTVLQYSADEYRVCILW